MFLENNVADNVDRVEFKSNIAKCPAQKHNYQKKWAAEP